MRQLNEGKLFVGLLQHRLDRAQRKLDMAEKQIDAAGKLMKLNVASATFNTTMAERLFERSRLNSKVRNWAQGCGVAVETCDALVESQVSGASESGSSEPGVIDEHEGYDRADVGPENSNLLCEQGGNME
jgi:hypothetical protein